jgi:hypothetical protein
MLVCGMSNSEQIGVAVQIRMAYLTQNFVVFKDTIIKPSSKKLGHLRMFHLCTKIGRKSKKINKCKEANKLIYWKKQQ